MRWRRVVPNIVLLLSAVSMTAGTAGKNSVYKLKPGIQKQICRDCHDEFLTQIERKFVHTPVKRGDCTGCHNPHASQHQKLLGSSADKICATCHTVTKEKSVSQHAPALAGECTKCHDAHASDNRGTLVAPQIELCGSCHEELVGRIAKVRRPHKPLAQKGCTVCHAPHESSTPHLLREPAPRLCKGCHDVRAKQFGAAHLGYAVANASCTGCHDPHGSSQKGMLYDTVHSPMASKDCDACHSSPRDPTKTRAAGTALCVRCHADDLASLTRGRRVHAAVTAGAGCVNCHTPHASAEPHLVRGTLVSACGTCHADTIARQTSSAEKHEPVAKGQCSICHEPHSGGGGLLFTRQNPLELCGACHDWKQHTSHPLGPGFKDPRNRNLTLDCLSCHRAHGTPYNNMLPHPTSNKLCVECHTDYQR